MSADWTTCRVVQDKDGDLWMRDAAHGLWCAPGEYFEPDVAELERDYGPLTPVLDAGGLPVVRTVGDLTARHIRRRVRVTIPGCVSEFTIHRIEVRGDGKAYLGYRSTYFTPEWLTLDTPCEVLDD